MLLLAALASPLTASRDRAPGFFSQALSLPGVAMSLVVAAWRYDIDLAVSWSIVPAVLLAALMANSVGFGFAHAIAEPRITNLIVNMIIFFVLLFSPVAFPISNFPDWFASVHRVLPFFHMANVIRGGLTEGLVDGLAASYLILGIWMIGAWVLAAWVVGRRGSASTSNGWVCDHSPAVIRTW